MRSTLGTSLIIAFLAFHKNQWLKDCSIDNKPVHCWHYVDDVFGKWDDILSWIFHWNGKKQIFFPVHKKNDKHFRANFWQISLLPICGKIFERLLDNERFDFFIINNLISTNQSSYKPGDSCINHLLSITHGIYGSFGEGYEVLGVFLDISKASDKVWHEGLIFKLKENAISGKLLHLINNFLSDKKQHVVLNGQCSSWTNVQPEVPQSSIPRRLYFLNSY